MRARWHLRANALVVAWLTAAAVVTVLHRWVPAAPWLMVHLLLLGGVSTAILIWSAHFAEAVRRRPLRGGRPAQAARLAGHTAGALAVVAGLLTSTWPLVVAGATLVGSVAAWHGVEIARLGRGGLGVPLGWTTRYFVASAAVLPVGATLGAVLASAGTAGDLAARAYVAHVLLMLLGWVGLTVVGTLVTLWPTMLRVRLHDDALPAARQGLVVLVSALVVVGAGAGTGLRPVVAVGLLSYVAGLVRTARPLVAVARSRPPREFAPLSVGLAVVWLTGSVLTWAVVVAAAPDWATAQVRVGALLAPLAVGFAAQVLLGALSHLGPMVLGGGPSAVRAARAEVERGGPARLVLVNAGLLVFVLPGPSLVAVGSSLLVLGGLVATAVLLVRAVLASRRHRAAPDAAPVPVAAAELLQPAQDRRTSRVSALAGAAAVVLVVAGGVAADPAALGLGASAAADVRPTGRTVEVDVEAGAMRFSPDHVEVTTGDRLVLVVTNVDSDVHDLVLDSGDATGRLAPGATGRLDVGVVGRDLGGWCLVAGHRQMGMTFTVTAVGAPDGGGAPVSGDDARGPTDGVGDAADAVDLQAPTDVEPHDAVLAPAPDGRVHRVTLEVREVEREVAPGVTQTLWTFGGTAPGPTLRGRVGDRFEITLVNDGTLGHSIDFHAGALAPDEPMRTIAPGETLTYTFTATRSGVWMYHCSTAPMSLHLANGMVGAVVVDPPDLPAVDREYLLVQHELYLGEQGGVADMDKIRADRPDLVVFNGHATQYREHPLPAHPGERVRLWVLAAGPSRSSAFHVVGGQFDVVYQEGAWLLGGPHDPPGTGGSQVLGLHPAQGGFVETVLPEPGTYPFVSHAVVDAERGATGYLQVTERP